MSSRPPLRVTEWDDLPFEPVPMVGPQPVAVAAQLAQIVATQPLVLMLVMAVGAWALASLSVWLSRFPGEVAALWFTNVWGVLLLLAVPMRQWPALMASHSAGALAANLAFGDPLLKALAFLPPNLIEIGLGAWLLTRSDVPRRLTDDPTACLQALLRGSLLPALAGASAAVPMLTESGEGNAPRLWLSWFEGSLMGSATLLPLGLAVLLDHAASLRDALTRLESLALALISVGLAVLALLQLPFPFVYLGLPLLLAALRLRFVAVSALVWLVATVVHTLMVQGLFAPPPQTAYWQQIFLYTSLLAALLPPLMLSATTEQGRARQRELVRSRERKRMLYERTPAMMMTTDAVGRVVAVSQHWLQRTGHERSAVIGRPAVDFMVEESRQRALTQIAPLIESTGRCLDVEYRLLRHDGQPLDVLWSATTEVGADGRLSRVHAVLEDVTRKRLAEALAAEHARSRVTLESIADAVISSDVRGCITYLNPVAVALIGLSPSLLLGRRYGEVLRRRDVDSGAELHDPIALCLLQRRRPDLPSRVRLLAQRGGERVVHESISPMFDGDGTLIGAVAVMQDVSEAHALALQLAHRAQHDALTGLPNRVLLHDRLKLALAMARRHRQRMALLFIDLDRFKSVNDQLGHVAGDDLLSQVAARLQKHLRGSDTAARIGGDEFVVLLPQVAQLADVERVALQLIEVLSRPYTLGPHSAQIGASIGIACYPLHGDDEATLMRCADSAMYRAKQDGRGRIQVFEPAD